LPGLSRTDFAGMVAGIFGMIVAAILAAAVADDDDSISARAAAAILIAIGVTLANMAHVVGLTLMGSISYLGGFAKFFRYLALIGTPLAIVVILVFNYWEVMPRSHRGRSRSHTIGMLASVVALLMALGHGAG